MCCMTRARRAWAPGAGQGRSRPGPRRAGRVDRARAPACGSPAPSDRPRPGTGSAAGALAARAPAQGGRMAGTGTVHAGRGRVTAPPGTHGSAPHAGTATAPEFPVVRGARAAHHGFPDLARLVIRRVTHP
jgi:hypothetical protein